MVNAISRETLCRVFRSRWPARLVSVERSFARRVNLRWTRGSQLDKSREDRGGPRLSYFRTISYIFRTEISFKLFVHFV